MEYIIKGTQIKKSFKGFHLELDELRIPKGFATALIGENGAGKSTLFHILSGVRLDYKGTIDYFGNLNMRQNEAEIKERIGYTAPNEYFLPHWTIKQVKELQSLLFQHFHPNKFDTLCEEMALNTTGIKGVSNLSDGNRMKLMLACVLARDTDCLLLDEPASPLDPLMRDKLCSMIRSYLAQKDGERSVFFSTHNIADMEQVTDYAIILEQGKIVEQGFVEDLKEKYISVKCDQPSNPALEKILLNSHKSPYGMEGICLTDQFEGFSGPEYSVELPTLSQICVAVMKQHSKLH